MRARIESERYALGSGDVILLPRDRYSELDSVPGVPWLKVWITAQGSLLDALVSAYGLRHVAHVRRAPVKYLYKRAFAISASSELAERDKRKALVVVFHELLVELASECAHRRNPLSEDVLRMKGYLDNRVERMVGLAELGALTGLCKAHVIRKFKGELGVSPYAYLLGQKMEHAKLLLSTSGLRVKEVARRTGFSNEYYFSNVFKRKTGFSPTAYRARV